MKQSVSLVTLGVSDYERSKAFYEALGWSAVLDIEETAFVQANGVVLVLWGVMELRLKAPLVAHRQRVEGPPRLAGHIAEDDDHRERRPPEPDPHRRLSVGLSRSR